MAIELRPPTKEEIRKLLNNMTPGADTAKLGDIIISLQDKVAELEDRVAELESA